jgi:hypothetical protein
MVRVSVRVRVRVRVRKNCVPCLFAFVLHVLLSCVLLHFHVVSGILLSCLFMSYLVMSLDYLVLHCLVSFVLYRVCVYICIYLCVCLRLCLCFYCLVLSFFTLSCLFVTETSFSLCLLMHTKIESERKNRDKTEAKGTMFNRLKSVKTAIADRGSKKIVTAEKLLRCV